MKSRLLVGLMDQPPVWCLRGWGLSPAAALGHPAQSQHVEADVAHPHRLVQVKLDDGDLLDRALVAQQAPTVAAREPSQTHRVSERRGSCAGRNGATLLTSDASGSSHQTWQHIHSSWTRRTTGALWTTCLKVETEPTSSHTSATNTVKVKYWPDMMTDGASLTELPYFPDYKPYLCFIVWLGCNRYSAEETLHYLR